MLVPNRMTETERVLRALDGLGLPMATRVREALTLHALVIAAALPLADEVEAEQETGVPLDRWWPARRARADELLAGGYFPLPATITRGRDVGPGRALRVRPRTPPRRVRRPGGDQTGGRGRGTRESAPP